MSSLLLSTIWPLPVDVGLPIPGGKGDSGGPTGTDGAAALRAAKAQASKARAFAGRVGLDIYRSAGRNGDLHAGTKAVRELGCVRVGRVIEVPSPV